MAQFYTLEEAARVLGMSAEELKAKAQSREVRAFLDGGSWRFRVVDVDELARRRGLGQRRRAAALRPRCAGRQELRRAGRARPFRVPSGSRQARSGLRVGAHLKDWQGGPQGAQGYRVGSRYLARRSDCAAQPGDRVELGHHRRARLGQAVPAIPTSGSCPIRCEVSSDSDVQLASPSVKQPSDSDVTLIKEDTADHGVTGSGSSSETSVRVSPLLGSSAEVPAAASDSDFELNPSSELIDALQPDSGSDFELSALDAAATSSKPRRCQGQRLGRDRI